MSESIPLAPFLIPAIIILLVIVRNVILDWRDRKRAETIYSGLVHWDTMHSQWDIARQMAEIDIEIPKSEHQSYLCPYCRQMNDANALACAFCGGRLSHRA